MKFDSTKSNSRILRVILLIIPLLISGCVASVPEATQILPTITKSPTSTNIPPTVTTVNTRTPTPVPSSTNTPYPTETPTKTSTPDVPFEMYPSPRRMESKFLRHYLKVEISLFFYFIWGLVTPLNAAGNRSPEILLRRVTQH